MDRDALFPFGRLLREESVSAIESARDLRKSVAGRLELATCRPSFVSGMWERMELAARRAISLLESVGDAWGVANAHRRIGVSLMMRGSPEEPIEHYSEALEMFRRIGDTQMEGKILNNMGDGGGARPEGGHGRCSRQF